MNWAFAIERQRAPLLRIIATLFAMIGGAEAGERVSRRLYRAALSVLRPAESAVRRLIVAAARGLVVKPRPRRPAPAGLMISGKGQGRMSFRLFDPQPRFDDGDGRLVPRPRRQLRIGFIDVAVAIDPRIPLFRPAASAPAREEEDAIEDDSINAAPLRRRLVAIKRALEDLPRQARRLARWRARPLEARRPRLAAPLRFYRPPGFRRRRTHEVDAILAECNWLAGNAQAADTS